jgi:hypothetical protein
MPFSYCTQNAVKRLGLQAYILPASKQRAIMTKFGLLCVENWVVLRVEVDNSAVEPRGSRIIELKVGLADIPNNMDDPNGSLVLGPKALKKLGIGYDVSQSSVSVQIIPDSLKMNLPEDD